METRSGDPRFPVVANKAAELIEFACETIGFEVDEAVCILCNVAADYARSMYGAEYLEKLAALIIERGKSPLPTSQEGGEP